MILVRNLRLDIGRDVSELRKKAAKQLGVPECAIKSFELVKRSLDARKKNDIHWLCSAAVTLSDEKRLLSRNKSRNIAEY